MTQPCSAVPFMVSSCWRVRPKKNQELNLEYSESLFQGLSNDAPNFFQALSRQNLAFGKVRNRPHFGSLSHESALNAPLIKHDNPLICAY